MRPGVSSTRVRHTMYTLKVGRCREPKLGGNTHRIIDALKATRVKT